MGRTKNRKLRPIGELRFRENLALKFIDALETNPELKDDPLAPGAIKEYERQLASILKQIDRHQPPEDIVIGLKPGQLAGQAS